MTILLLITLETWLFAKFVLHFIILKVRRDDLRLLLQLLLGHRTRLWLFSLFLLSGIIIVRGQAFGALDFRGNLSDLILCLLHGALLQGEERFTGGFSRVWRQSNFNQSVPEAFRGNKHAIVWICG
jgi:hypothetical protein